MFQLSVPAVKDEYKNNANTDVLLGKEVVHVILDYVSTKSGSWERGFKFGSITYGILRRTIKKKSTWQKGKTYNATEYSADHGATWHNDTKLAKKSKGKVIVDKPKPTGEFAFEGIQKLNREYHGADYKWKP
jgi:hypothetical protein